MPEGPSRRTALTLGLVGAGTVAAGVIALRIADAPPFAQPAASTSPSVTDGSSASSSWVEPPVVESVDGVLDIELVAAPTEVSIAGGLATMLGYNGSVPGPTLHARPGDVLRIRLVNGLDVSTNLHTHGLQVSPVGNSDNPFLEVVAGTAFDYEILIPPDHPPGVFWYHPHRHGRVADQVFAGLYGAIVVDEHDWTEAPPRVVVVSDVTLDAGEVAPVSVAERRQGRLGEAVLVNGQVAPMLPVTPGAAERLLVVNACVSRYLDLDPGGATMRLRGIDGGGFAPASTVGRVLLAPGNRADLEIDMPSGEVALMARAHPIGAMGMGMMGGVAQPEDALLLTLSPDDGAGTPSPVPVVPAALADLRGAEVSRTRTLTLSMAMGGGMRFLIDGEEFDAARVDQRVELGAVEEWVLRNTSPMDHPFHLHVWPMQLMAADRVDVRDVVHVPAGEETVVRIAFDRLPGRTVYHCHVLDHEDLGMMGVIELEPAADTGAEVPEEAPDAE